MEKQKRERVKEGCCEGASGKRKKKIAINGKVGKKGMKGRVFKEDKMLERGEKGTMKTTLQYHDNVCIYMRSA